MVKTSKEYTQYTNILSEFIKLKENKEPIRRGCTNGTCFCTGKCQEIIGWREKPTILNEDLVNQIIKKDKNDY